MRMMTIVIDDNDKKQVFEGGIVTRCYTRLTQLPLLKRFSLSIMVGDNDDGDDDYDNDDDDDGDDYDDDDNDGDYDDDNRPCRN